MWSAAGNAPSPSNTTNATPFPQDLEMKSLLTVAAKRLQWSAECGSLTLAAHADHGSGDSAPKLKLSDEEGDKAWETDKTSSTVQEGTFSHLLYLKKLKDFIYLFI